RKSLRTNVFSVAKLRLPDLMTERRSVQETASAARCGKMSFADALRLHCNLITVDPSLKPNSREYWRKIIGFIEKSWPEALTKDVRKLGEPEMRSWLTKFCGRYA